MIRIRNLHGLGLWLLFGFAAMLIGAEAVPGSDLRTVEGLQIQAEPARIIMHFSAKTDYKIIRFEDDQGVSIAFKGARLAADMQSIGSGSAWLQEMRFEQLPEQVLALRIRTRSPAPKIIGEWAGDTKTLTIAFGFTPARLVHKRRALGLKPKPSSVKLAEAQVPPDQQAPVPLQPIETVRKKDGNAGTVDDLLDMFASDSCGQEDALRRAADDCRKELYDDAYHAIVAYLRSGSTPPCAEAAYFLRGLAIFKGSEGADEFQLLQVANELQDAVSFYPQSKYTPFAQTMLGKINLELNNDTEAAGYFRLVLNNFKDYSGTPEVLFEMGRLSAKTKKLSQAVSFFDRILSQYPGCAYEKDARLELGKTYFNSNRFSKALDYLEPLLESFPNMAYTSNELLVTMGNCYYQTGKYDKAREVLAKAYNFFPDMPDNHVALTRIGDVYLDEKDSEKAQKIYEEVRKKYPKTDGFVISSMRLAELEPNPEGKEKIYRMIIEDFPHHPMADLSKLRLAEIQQKAGLYENSIAMINELLHKGAKALKKEALYLQERSFEEYFQQMLANNDHPRAMHMAEKEKAALKRLDSPQLFYLSGKAFYLGHLYPQAVENLEKAQKLFVHSARPKDLSFLLGRAFQETGAMDEALAKLEQYLRDEPKGEHWVEAHMRIGRGRLAKKDYLNAETSFQTAYTHARTDLERANILMLQAAAAGETGKKQEKCERLIKAINLFAADPDANFTAMSSAYRELGETYMGMGTFERAADAFSMALKFLRQEEGQAGLRYLLAESYRKGKASDRAAAIYRELVATGDPIWGKLAEEKLRSMSFIGRLERT